jgi:hypothetical protein
MPFTSSAKSSEVNIRVHAYSEDVLELVGEHLADPQAGWSIGTFGAIAEFMYDTGEAAELATRSVTVTASTARGAIRIVVSPQLRPVAFERPAGAGTHWAHSVALCLPGPASAMSRRTVITELGPDTEAVRAQDRGDPLFDLGLGAQHIDACVRTHDPEIIARLRAAAGTTLFDPATGVAAALASLHPHRVFASRAGRIEVFTPIPPPHGTSPEGPHTHLLPALLASRRSYPHTEPIPPGWLPAAYVVPPHPTRDLLGRQIPFDRARYDRFQELLRRYGDPTAVAAKSGIIQAVLAGDPPPPDPSALLRPTRRAATLALSQVAYLSSDPELLRRWAAALEQQANSSRGPDRGLDAGSQLGASAG